MIAFCLLGGVLTCAVPYFVPVAFAYSESYCFGFNNRVSWTLFLLFAAVFAWWHGPVTALEPRRRELGEGRGISRSALVSGVLLAVFAGVSVWMFAAAFEPVNEAVYMLDRLRHLAAGWRVYRDFEFAYGAGMLYLPLWCSRLFRISLVNGYYLALLLEWVAGVILAAYCVDRLARQQGLRGRRADVLFLVLVLTSVMWWMLSGPQYTPLRYWLAPAVALFSVEDRAFSAGGVRLPSLGLPCGFALLLWLSPEQAVALLAGSVLLWAFFPKRVPVASSTMGLLILLAVPLLWFATKAGVFDTARAMGSGGYATPVTPGFDLLAGLLVVVAAACDVVERFRLRLAPGAETYFVCIGIFLIPAAMGRYDDVHLLCNTFVLALVGWSAVARGDRVWRWGMGSYIAIVLLLPFPALVRDAVSFWRYGGEVRTAEQSLPAAAPATARALAGPLYAPTGPNYGLWTGKRYPVKLEFGHFFGLENVMTRWQAEQKVAEIRAHAGEAILVAPYGCVMSGNRRQIMAFTKGLFAPKPRRTSDLIQPICDELDEHWVDLPGTALPYGAHVRTFRP